MSINFSEASIANLSIHKVGQKSEEEGVIISKNTLSITDDIKNLLTHYFVTSFKFTEYFNLYHDSDVSLNEVYVYASKIFDNPATLHGESVNLAKHLYDQSTHPNIKSGEFYVVHFKDCVVEGKAIDAIGLFKSENKDTFLKVYPSEGNFEIESEQGININKLDKGAIIFNTDQENGYVVSLIDNTNKGNDARYWIDDFLHVRQRQDNYYNTNGVMTMYKNFVTKEFPNQFEDATKADQADLLNRSVQFFKDKDKFDINEFTSEVLEQPKVIDSFNQFKSNYQQERDVEISDSFDISDSAVKKQARAYKSVIKLDKNFHIYVHGGRDKIEQGEDERGRYYKVYYDEEA